MTVEELHDEVRAIDAIYPDSVTDIAPQIYTFKIPNHECISIQLTFPENYPEESPQLLQIINDNRSRFTDNTYLERNINEILQRAFVPEQVMLFELLTELQEFFDRYVEEHPVPPSPPPEKKKDVEEETVTTAPMKKKESVNLKVEVDPTIGWEQSDPIIDRKSTFIAYARKVSSLEEAQSYLNELITDKKISRATHNISSWRIKTSDGIQFQDCDDDGETAAGGRLLHVLQVC